MKVEILDFLNSKKNMMALAIVLIIGYSLPYLLLRENGHYLIHDNLDSVFVWYKVLIESGHIFSGNDTPIEAFMSGVPRGSFPSELNLTLWVYYILGPLNSYIFERLLFSFVGFWGMYLLLKRHIISGEHNALIQIGVAVTFALLPHWPGAGLTVAGLPIVMYAFLNIREQNHDYFNWMVLFIYPFYSSLILGGIFLLILLGVIFIYDFLISKKLNVRFFIAIVMLSGLYLLSHYRLLMNFLIDSTYISHRVEFISEKQSLRDCVSELFNVLIAGQFHAQSLQKLIVIPTILFAIVSTGIYRALLLFYPETKKIYRFDKPNFKVFGYVILFILSTSILYGFIEWGKITWLNKIIFQYFPLQVQRFYFLHPFLWPILFAISLTLIRDQFSIGKYFVVVLLVMQTLYVVRFHEFIRYRDKPTFKEFFAESQFAEIKQSINIPLKDYKVISIGIHPSISQWNGFFTLDGYAVDYPLDYKHQFRGIIEGELKKNEQLEEYFDNWGSRAYVFVSDNIGYFNRKGNDFLIQELDLNTAQLKSMNCLFIISSVKINELKNPEWELMDVFTSESSAWDIYLYKII